MKSEKEVFEEAYRKPDKAVWTHRDPPELLVSLIESGKIKPCKALDIGCGEGYYSIYLAKRGFDVMGIDLSENAIEYAKDNSKKENQEIKFLVLDVKDLDKIEEKFDFILEWTLLHQIEPKVRENYVQEISRIIKKRGKMLSISFNIDDPKMTGPGVRIREIPKESKGPTGGKLYFSPLKEIEDLFSPYFRIIESKVTEMIRGGKTHIINYLLMEKI